MAIPEATVWDAESATSRAACSKAQATSYPSSTSEENSTLESSGNSSANLAIALQVL